MKTVVLTDGTMVPVLNVIGEKHTIQGARRDVLTFVMDGTITMDELDQIFNEANCERITIVEEDGQTQNVHYGYAIRAGLSKNPEMIQPESSGVPAVYENRVTVSMAQRTYAEAQLARLAAESMDTQVAVAELAEMITGGAE